MNSAPSSDSRGLDSLVTVRAFAPGEKMFGRYVLERILGRGGMGVVWLARDTELEQEIALKFLPEVVLGDNVALDDLKRETRRSRELTHPHIVRIHDFLRDERTAAISMEFIDGSTLAERRLTLPQRVFEAETLVPWVRQLCEALDHAHTRPKAVIHRDLKPANLMVTTAGELKVTDFGIASSVSDSVSRVSMAMGSSGTPVYMSPQQMMGERPNVTDDVYAFGATIYELLTSKPPFFSGNVPLQVQSRVPLSLAERRAELEITGQPIPAHWEELIAACLSKEPGSRPQSFRSIESRIQPGPAVAGPAPDSHEVTIRSLGGSTAMPSMGDQVTVVQRTTKPGGTATSLPATDASSLPPRTQQDQDGASAEAAASEEVSAVAAATGVKLASAGTIEPVAGGRKRSRTAFKWSIGLAAAAAIGVAVIWGGDVLGRYRAAESAKRAAAALLAGDWDGALSGYQAAHSMRTSDAEHRRAFDEAQQAWLRELTAGLSGLSPENAFARLQGASSETAKRLVDGHASQFRQLVDDTAGKVRTNVRAGLTRAEGLAQRGRFNEAYAEIAGIEAYRGLVEDFEQEVDRVRAIEVRAALQRALSSAGRSDFEEAFAALKSVEAHRGLVPEYEGTLTRVRESQVRHEINAAIARSSTGDFDGAIDALAATEERDILSGDIAAAREQVRAAQVREEIAAALARSAQGDFDAALEMLASTAKRGPLPDEVFGARATVREAQVRHEIDQAMVRLSAGDFDGALARIGATEKRGVLAGEVASARAKVQETQVRSEIESALARLAEGDFKGAVAGLDSAERRGLLPSEIAGARAQVRRKGEETSIDRLPGAIKAGEAAGVQAIIDDFAVATGYELETSAKQLLGETNLEGYLRALEDLRLRPVKESERTNYLDLILVEAQRARFDNRTAVAAFLGQGYASWARKLLADQHHGFALYVLQRARAEGVTVDAALEHSAITALAREFDFRLLVARPETDKQTPAVLQSMPLDRLRTRVSASVAAWMPLADAPISARGSTASTGIVLRTSVRGVDTQDNRAEETQYARYQSGWSERANPEYEQIATDLNHAEYNAQQIAMSNAQNQNQVRSATSSGNLDRTSAVLYGVASGLSSMSVAAAQREVSRLRGLLASTPRTIREPVYASEPYSVITHNMTYSADFAAEIEWQGGVVGRPQRFQASSSHQTVEVAGNTARGVTARRPEYPDSATIARRLASDLATQVNGGADLILADLGDATFRALAWRMQDRKALPAEVADRKWGLLQLWRNSGVELPSVELEHSVRDHLGLPASIPLPVELAAAPPETAPVVTVPAAAPPVPNAVEAAKSQITLANPSARTAEHAKASAPDVYEIQDLDKLPVPTAQTQPVLSSALKRAGVKGTVVLAFVVDTRGRVRDVEIVRSTRKELERPATEAMLKWKFRPGVKNSNPVNARMQRAFVFK